MAPGSVWIRQEVEVTGVEMINYTCTGTSEPSDDPRPFLGVEVTWFGGGFRERELHAEVHFWISNDGNVPDDDQADSGHRVFRTALESPNLNRVELVDFARLADIRDSDHGWRTCVRALGRRGDWLAGA